MPQHGLGIIGADEHQLQLVFLGEVADIDVAGLAHRARVERRDLRHIVVGGADEPRGVRPVGDLHTAAVDTVGFQPGAVLGEIRADGADQQRRPVQQAHGVRDIARDPTAADLQIIDQEAQRHMVELVGQQRVGEPSGETHQVVCGNRCRYCDSHEARGP